MTGGKNGATPLQNLAQMQRKPLFEERAELEHSKCPAHPTKRMWISDVDAIREAEARTVAAKMPIAAYRCDSCGNAHLAKRANVRPGSLLSLPEAPERNWEVFTKPTPGNADAKRKIVAEYLEGRTEASTKDLMELLGVGPKAVGRYLSPLGWHNTRGRNARWVLGAAAPAAKPVKRLRAVNKPVDKPVELAKHRHPSAQNVGWRPMLTLDRIRHMPVGDLIDTLEAVGLELRIMTREKES